VTTAQKQKLDDVAEDLFDYVDNVKIIKELFDELQVKVGIASPYLNFRDALFHFKKMNNYAGAGNNAGFIQQCACIEEHLNRGLKDFAIYLCSNVYARIINKMLNLKSVNNNYRHELRKVYHCIKNLVIDIRLEGQTLRHFDDHKNVWLPKLINAIKAFNDLLEKSPSLKQAYRRFSAEITAVYQNFINQ